MGQSSGVLLKEVAAFGRCPLTEVSLYSETLLIAYHLNRNILDKGIEFLIPIVYKANTFPSR